jgi:hypothetical protein
MPAKGQEPMDQTDHIWTPHLEPGERVLWSGAVSDDLFRAAAARRMWMRLAIMGVAGIAAFLFGLNFLRDMQHLSENSSGLAASLGWPLQLAFALACLIVAAAQPFRLKLPPPQATRFAVTLQRVLAANDAGALVDQVHARDIDALKLTRDLIIHRSKDGAAIDALVIAYADGLGEAKTLIESQLLEQTP